jgi:ADP-ribose pyrophosphatase YjhB (NUDIX family)
MPVKPELLNYSVEDLATALLNHPKRGVMGKMTTPEFILGVTGQPSVAIECVITFRGRILLIYREDADFKDWHIPGGLLYKHENFIGGFSRIIRKKTGLLVEQPRCIGVCNYNDPSMDPRHFEGKKYPTHFVGLVYMAEAIVPQDWPQQLTAGELFHFTMLPSKTLKSHRKIIQMAKKAMGNPSFVGIEQEK